MIYQLSVFLAVVSLVTMVAAILVPMSSPWLNRRAFPVVMISFPLFVVSFSLAMMTAPPGSRRAVSKSGECK